MDKNDCSRKQGEEDKIDHFPFCGLFPEKPVQVVYYPQSNNDQQNRFYNLAGKQFFIGYNVKQHDQVFLGRCSDHGVRGLRTFLLLQYHITC